MLKSCAKNPHNSLKWALVSVFTSFPLLEKPLNNGFLIIGIMRLLLRVDSRLL